MNLMETRQAIVDAFNEMEGMSAFLFKPKVLQPGDTWVVQGPLTKDQESGMYEATFYIVVFLHQEETAAAQQFSDYWEAVSDVTNEAVRDIVYINQLDLVNLGSGNDTSFAMQITARSDI